MLVGFGQVSTYNLKLKVKILLFLIKYHAMNTHGGSGGNSSHSRWYINREQPYVTAG